MAKKTKKAQQVAIQQHHLDNVLTYPISTNPEELKVGQIVSVTDGDNEPAIMVCHGLTPIGVVTGVGYGPNEDQYCVEFRRFVGTTDMFVEHENFPFVTGANLYCAEGGRFSSVSLGYLPVVGIVMRPPTPTNPLLQFMWL